MKEENRASIFSIWRSDSPVTIFNKKIEITWLKLLTLERIKKKSNKKLYRDNRGLTHPAGKTLKIFLDGKDGHPESTAERMMSPPSQSLQTCEPITRAAAFHSLLLSHEVQFTISLEIK